MKKNLPYLLLVAIFYFSGLFGAYAFVSPNSSGGLLSPEGSVTPVQTPSAGKPLVAIDPGEVKDQKCPLNGLSYTKTEKALWEKHRPLAVMIENHEEARPQSGLSSADIVYEAVAEGGITRFMGVFYCDIAAQDLILGPVRSARTYFLDWASEYGKYPLYAHVGGANLPGKSDALGQIKDYGWYGANDLNQFGLSVKECWRDYNRLGHDAATEHTMYCSTDKLYQVAAKRGFTNVDKKGDSWTKFFIPWTFAEDAAVGDKPASTIAFDFWKDYTQYAVKWNYDSATKTYKRENAGAPHIDRNTNKQIETGTVVVQYVTETGPINENKHMLYGTIGTGSALIFHGGQAQTATWAKKTRLDRTIFKDSKGKEIEFAPGKIWIEVLAKNAVVNYN